MDLLPASDISASALNAEKMRMEIIAQNIANAQTSKTASGEPYRRQIVAFESVLNGLSGGDSSDLRSVEVKGIYDDKTSFKEIYNPGHPHADENGMVKMPNVDLSMEMVDMISASRSYEANLAVMKTSRQLAKQALTISL